jgi:hypothetical protein
MEAGEKRSQPFHILFTLTTQSFSIIEIVINKTRRFDKKSSLPGAILPMLSFQEKSWRANL